MPERPWFQPSAALAAYAESMALGHAVVVFGDATSGLGERLLERGARIVHVYDRDTARAAEAVARNSSNNLSIAPLGDGALAVRDGAFDVAIVEDLGSVGDPAGLLKSLRRAIAPRGIALVACANPDVRVRLLPAHTSSSTPVSFDYYTLFDAISAEFDCIRMLGQTPFVGYAIVDFAPEDEPSPTIDTDFVPGGSEEPEWYVALASQHPQSLAEFMVVQLPFRSALTTGTTRRLEEQLRAAQASERRARTRMADLESECARLLRGERSAPKPDLAQASEPLYKAIEQRDNWIAQLEARASTADARADEVQAELESEHERAEQLALEVASARAESERLAGELGSKGQQQHELDTVRQAAEEQRVRSSELERMLAQRDARIAELEQTSDDTSAKEVTELEAQLRAQGKELLRLQRELRVAERVGRELVNELESHGAMAAEPAETHDDLAAKLNALAGMNAQWQADLAAARWTIEQLESRLEDYEDPSAVGATNKDDPSLMGLTRELAWARAELQRQQVLLEQAKVNGDALAIGARSEARDGAVPS